jgi:hypothetical protein
MAAQKGFPKARHGHVLMPLIHCEMMLIPLWSRTEVASGGIRTKSVPAAACMRTTINDFWGDPGTSRLAPVTPWKRGSRASLGEGRGYQNGPISADDAARLAA